MQDKEYPAQPSRDLYGLSRNCFRDSGSATARSTVIPTMGEGRSLSARGRFTTTWAEKKKRGICNRRCLFGIYEITSEIPQQQQPRKRSYRPWGCYQRPGSPSSQRQIRLAAALGLRRRDFWSRKPDFSQNKKYIARKQYVVLSFHGDILSHHVFTKQGVLT